MKTVVAPHWDWTADVWTAPQLAAYLEVSASFVRKKIREGEIEVTEGGPLKYSDPSTNERQYYRITQNEVRRVAKELSLPATGETFAERLERGLRRLGKTIPSLADPRHLDRILNLDIPTPDARERETLLFFASRRPRRRRRTAGES